MCEAERLINMAVFEIDLQRGNGAWNFGRIQAILKRAHECNHEQDKAA